MAKSKARKPKVAEAPLGEWMGAYLKCFEGAKVVWEDLADEAGQDWCDWVAEACNEKAAKAGYTSLPEEYRKARALVRKKGRPKSVKGFSKKNV
jgi:hypothetical protein